MLDKMKFETKNITSENTAKIASLFPEAVVEGKINFDLLRALLGDDALFGDEAYEFTWVGKREAIAEAGRPIRKTLRPCLEESKDWDSTENLYIEGDNLDVLKLLQESYLGKVKMIYIDPPYNTGNDLVYRDKWVVGSGQWVEETGEYDEETEERLFRNTESNGRFHSDWCSMIYPRLVLGRNLLRDDGVIFISIDDNEVHNLRKICDEVFGAVNFVADILWNSTKSVTNTALISVSHTHILVYFKRIDYYIQNRSQFRLPDDGDGFENPDNDPRGAWKADPFQVGGWRPNQQYTITNPNTGVEYKPNPNCSWKNDYNKYQELLADNRIVFGKTGDSGPQRKRFIWEAEERGKVTKTWWDDVETTTNGTQQLKKIFDDTAVFDNPKPIGLIKKILQLSTNKGGKNNDIILDFFSGSSTTAQAVMQLNAEDNGRRKFIMVQLPEPCAADSEAAKAGYRTICDIGKERIRRSGEKIVFSFQCSVFREEMRKYGCVKLSRSDCLAKGDGFDNGNLSVGEKTSEGGAVLAVRPNAAGGGVDSVEHSGRSRQKFKKGVFAVSGDSEGFEGGIGNADIDLRQSGIPCRYGHFGSDAAIVGDRENVECPYFKTENCPLKTENCFLDIGFRVLKLADSNTTDIYYAPRDYTQDLLSTMESNIKPDRTDMDLLYGCLLDWGLPLTMPHTREDVSGFTVHTCQSGDRIDLTACFDNNISEAVIREIARRAPIRAVFRDSCFADSPGKINVFEIFKLLAPETKVRVI